MRTLRGRFPTAGGDRVQAARDFLSRHALHFGLAPDLEGLDEARYTESPGGVSVTFSQRYRGVEVFAGAVLVAFDRDADIVHVRNAAGVALDLDVVPTHAAHGAVQRAGVHLGLWLPTATPVPRLMVVRGGKGTPGWHLTWRVEAQTPAPRLGDWYVFVSAHSGRVVRALDRLKHGGAPCVPCNPAADPACGLVLFENPVDALDDPFLTDGANTDAVQTGCALTNLTSATVLDGLYANTSLSAPRVSPPYNTLRSAGQTALDEVNAYFHANRAKEFLNSLGHASVMSYSIDMDAHDGSIGDQSYYSPSDHTLHFGEGGVDDAQDADVVYHEYGHAIQDDQVPGYGLSAEGGATGEAFGDYWAAAITDTSSCEPELGLACVAGWDAVSYNPYSGSTGSGCLRRLDSAKQYPADFVWQVHADGEIWGAALWSLRGQLGGPTVDALVIQAHTYLTSNANFIDAADGLLSADVALHGGANASAIHTAMQAQGLPRTGTPASTAGMSQWAAFGCSSGHNYASGEYTACSYTVPGADRVRFRFSSFNTEQDFDNVYISDADFLQVERLSGNLGANVLSAAVSGDTIVARFKADDSAQRYGFDIDRVYYSAPTCTGDDDCDDANACTDDVCDAVTGCQNVNNTAGCNDNDACTNGDVCGGGVCAGVAVSCDDGNPCNGAETCSSTGGCQSGPPPSCSDGNPCTTDFCDAAAGGCRHQNNNAPCSDGDACTIGDQCAGGVCTAWSPLLCDDGNPCNGVELCNSASGCQAGPPLNCNDGDPCTYDSCNSVTGCTHAAQCFDAGVPDGSTPWPDGGIPWPDGGIPWPDGSTPWPDGGIPVPDGGIPWPDGSTPWPDGGVDSTVQPVPDGAGMDSFSPRPGCSCSHPGGGADPGLLFVLALGLWFGWRRRRV